MVTSGMIYSQALWLTAPREAGLRDTAIGTDGVEVVARFSGISRGTERLVYEGRVPASEHDRMRAPFQEGTFTFPVKYGYAMVGEVASGQGRLSGRLVFALHPHQTRFRVPEAMLTVLPEGLPPGRAVLAANMETALNVVWDAGIAPGDRVAVVGAGVLGGLIGWLAAGIPGTDVTLVDRFAGRAALAAELGCRFALPDAAPGEADVVVHTSASAGGLATAIDLAGQEARIVEASWYGADTVAAPLGGAFHSRRLSLVSSQVGSIPPGRAPRWDYRRRLETALALLLDPVLDALISGETRFERLPYVYGDILSSPDTLCHRIAY